MPNTKSLSNLQPKVAILLCTFNGQKYLAEQLDSFARQTHLNWDLWVSDDGSSDDSILILSRYRERWKDSRLEILSGPRKGFLKNYLSLTCNKSIHADYYAYSDQDDVWQDIKLERALNWLNTVSQNIPALYCARTQLVDDQCNDIGFSPLFIKPPSFRNALIQSIAGGNTMVFNNAARSLLCEAGADINVVAHDWWAYMVVSGCGGMVFCDAHPTVLYRQHQNNIVGMNSSWRARFSRICMLFRGTFRIWNDANISGLQRLGFKLTSENRSVLDKFILARSEGVISRLINLKNSRVYRQTVFGNVGLFVAAIFNKI